MRTHIEIDLSTFYSDTAKLSDLANYIEKAKSLAGEGMKLSSQARHLYGST